MTIILNDEKKEVASGINIKDLLSVENVQNPDMLSVMVNDSFVHKNDYEAHILNENDNVNFLYFMGGGA